MSNDPYSRFQRHTQIVPLHISPSSIRPFMSYKYLYSRLSEIDCSLENGNLIGGGGSGSVDAILEEVVHKAIREVVFGDEKGLSSVATSSSGMIEMAEPIPLPFEGLELQGEDNSALYAVGNNVNDETDSMKKKNQINDDEDEEDDGVFVVDDWSTATMIETAVIETSGPSGWEMLEKLVHSIQNELESKYGLKTCWPLDKPQGEEIDYDDPMVAAIKQKQRKWRPRVPFVRLPSDSYRMAIRAYYMVMTTMIPWLNLM